MVKDARLTVSDRRSNSLELARNSSMEPKFKCFEKFVSRNGSCDLGSIREARGSTTQGQFSEISAEVQCVMCD